MAGGSILNVTRVKDMLRDRVLTAKCLPGHTLKRDGC